MSKYFLILLVAGISFYLYRRSKNTSLNQKDSKVGETTVHRTQKNKPKVRVKAEDIEFEELKNHEH